MSLSKRELYFNSFDDLLDKTHLGEKTKNSSAKLLCKSAMELYRSGMGYMRGGDEEMALIMFMRYIQIISLMQRNVDYRVKEAELKPLFGGNECLNNALDTAELLRKNLIERYKERDNSSSVKNRQNENNNRSITPEPTIIEQKPKVTSQTSISARQLFEIIQGQQNNVLIMDCRPESDYNESKLKYLHCLNVPENIFRVGCSAGMIQNALSAKSKTLWACRSVKEQIILMDWQSTENDMSPPISTLKNILLDWDPDVDYKNPILILDGGYSGFMDFYPTLTTKPVNRLPKKFDNLTEIVNVQDIEYNTIQEVPMKDENVFQPIPGRPFIDRSSKAAAAKSYNAEKLLHEREQLVDNLLQNEQSILEKYNEIDGENVQKYNGDEGKLNEARLQLNNERIQLEDQQEELNRMKIENEDMRQQLQQEIAKNEQFRMQVDTTVNEEVEKRVAEKERRERELRDKRKLLEEERKERDQQLLEKRRRETEMAAKERLTKPTIPTIDRSVKPQLNYVDDQKRIRNFSGQGRSPGPGLTGLINIHNNCYMNNIVQCLSNTSDLVEYFLSNNYKQHINRSNQTHGQIAEELSAVFKEIWCKEYASIASIDFRNTVGHYKPMFAGAEHQDSHEFLTALIDWMHSDLEVVKRDVPKVQLTAADKAWLAFIKNKESVIFNLFYGQLKSTLKCVDCACESATYDSFSDLSLQVPSITSTDIEKCLDNFFYGEYIDDWDCPSCKTKRRAIKKLDISRLPKILVIHFKRFQVDLNDCGKLVNSSKKQVNISFPLTGLNMSKHIAPSAKASNRSKQIYSLYGVSNHYGTLSAGHYTAFCKSRVLEKWFKFDDKKVTQIDPTSVVTSAAYILFYTNESPSNISR